MTPKSTVLITLYVDSYVCQAPVVVVRPRENTHTETVSLDCETGTEFSKEADTLNAKQKKKQNFFSLFFNHK